MWTLKRPIIAQRKRKVILLHDNARRCKSSYHYKIIFLKKGKKRLSSINVLLKRTNVLN